MSEFDFKPELKKTIPWRLAAIFLLLTGVIIMIGSYYYKSERNRIFKEQEKILSAIASLKVRQIGQWYNEKLADAVVIKDNEPLESRIKQFLKDENQTGIRKEITIWLEALNKQYDYNSVAVLDTLLKVKIASSNADLLADDSIRDELNNVIRYHKIIMTDLHKTGTSHAIRMDLLVPLLDPLSKEQKTIGLVILCIDPDKILFPLVQSWPTPSKSSETLILRREGDSVIYLNELRHRKNTALNLKFPLSNVTLLATKAVNGFEGVTEGTDYRKIPVVGALSKIPGLPWYMVAKTDKEEILAPFKRYSIITVVVIILLIILNALVSGYWIWAQRAKMYRRQIKDEIALRESNEKLIASEERFRSLYENATIGIYRTTPDGKILLANPALVRMLGFSSFEDLAHRNLEVEGYEPDYPRAKFLKILEKEDKIIGLESAWHQRNGNNLYVRESASVIRDEEGKILYYDGNVEDITYRKQVDEALRESEKRLREAQEMAHLGFWLWDIKTGNVEWSDEVYKIFCLDPATFKPKIDSILELSPWPEDNQRDKELINRAIESHNPGTYEQKFLRPDKSIGYYYSTFRGSYDNNGDLVSIVGTILDITERKITEVALRESEERFSKSFRTSPISFIIANMEDGRIIEVNDAFTTISGYTRDEALNNTTLNLKIWVHEDDRKNMIDSLLKGKAILSKETMLRAKEGNVAIVLLSAQVIKLANRNCIISSIEDITERKNAESQIKKLNEELEDRVIQRTELLEAANKELEAFSYSVSHDLRAPLRSVHGFTKILLEDYEANLDEEGKRICGIISSSATQMGELIDDLLSFSRIGRSSMNPSAIDMKKMARVVFEGMTSPAERKRIKLNIGKLQKAYGDFTLFGQVWTNLISNAIKYSSKNDVSEISIGSKIAGDMIIYFIKDNGVGFDMQYAHKLFGVFQRLHSKVDFEGNGVGLAIVQRIVVKHGGKVWAEGEVGKGATFYFALPVQDKRQK
jgi:PAS domain S-box-containing protein